MDEHKQESKDVSSQLLLQHVAEGDYFLLYTMIGGEISFHQSDCKTV
jgi:hypothetical protein